MHVPCGFRPARHAAAAAAIPWPGWVAAGALLSRARRARCAELMGVLRREQQAHGMARSLPGRIG